LKRRPLALRAAGGLLAAATLLAGCFGGGPTRPPPAPTPALPTPLTVPTTAIETARSAVAVRLGEAGLQLEATNRRYRPSEPAVLQQAPHALYRIAGADRNQGWVVVYDLGSTDAAVAAAEQYAQYLATFGRANYPADAQFTINQLGSALVFNWWSRSRASDAAPLEAAFGAISEVGQRFQVRG